MSPCFSAAGSGSASGPGSTPGSAAALAGVRFLRSFDGLEPGPDILAAIREGRASGVTLFRGRNVATPQQVRALCATLQAARPAGDPPLVIGLDQEGGQLQAVGDGATAWPGNLALGATGSQELARRAGAAIGAEVAALGGRWTSHPSAMFSTVPRRRLWERARSATTRPWWPGLWRR